MSLKTWQKEFCPSLGNCKKMSWEKALKHCLKKYEGALPENRKRHGWPPLYQLKNTFFYGDQCAACKLVDDDICLVCELKKTNETVCSGGGAWSAFIKGSNPRPMISIIKKTLKRMKKEREE